MPRTPHASRVEPKLLDEAVGGEIEVHALRRVNNLLVRGLAEDLRVGDVLAERARVEPHAVRLRRIDAEPMWKSNFGRPAAYFRSCVCAMVWRFHAIEATLSPWPRQLDGVEVLEGPRNISQDNLAHWLISTQRGTGGTGR